MTFNPALKEEPRIFFEVLASWAQLYKGVRSLILTSYDIPKIVYELGIPLDGPEEVPLEGRRARWSAAFVLRELGCAVFYGDKYSHTGRKRRPPMDIEAMVVKWRDVVVGLALAHDKDEADRYEARVDEILTPILTAPVAQLREFGPRLLTALKEDRRVPFLVWRAYEVWIEQLKAAPDEDIKELKTDLAREIVNMVEDDAKRQLPDAMILALQWRSPTALRQVRDVVEAEKAAGRGVRLQGRESCLFLEAGGTVAEPAVCIQV